MAMKFNEWFLGNAPSGQSDGRLPRITVPLAPTSSDGRGRGFMAETRKRKQKNVTALTNRTKCPAKFCIDLFFCKIRGAFIQNYLGYFRERNIA